MPVDIFYIEYLDHAYSEEDLDEIKKKPFTLWSIGHIFKEESDYLVVVPNGAKYREKKPSGYDIILKNCIIKKEKIFTIPEE